MEEGQDVPEEETGVLGILRMPDGREDGKRRTGENKALDQPGEGDVGKEDKIVFPIAEIDGIEDQGDGDAGHDFRDDESRSIAQVDVMLDEERKITHAMCIR